MVRCQYSKEELAEGRERKKVLVREIKKLQGEKKELEARLQEAAAVLQEEATRVNKATKKLSYQERELLGKIETECFVPFQIDCSAYHGGDLTGNPIRQLMTNAHEVFGEIKRVLWETNTRKSKYTDKDMEYFLS